MIMSADNESTEEEEDDNDTTLQEMDSDDDESLSLDTDDLPPMNQAQHRSSGTGKTSHQ